MWTKLKLVLLSYAEELEMDILALNKAKPASEKVVVIKQFLDENLMNIQIYFGKGQHVQP